MTDTPLSDDVVERVARALDPEAWKLRDEDVNRREEWEANIRVGWGEWTFEQWVNRFVGKSLERARAALEAARYGELERYLNESRPYLEAFRLKEAGQALMGEIDRMSVRQLCKRADALLSSIGASQPLTTELLDIAERTEREAENWRGTRNYEGLMSIAVQIRQYAARTASSTREGL